MEHKQTDINNPFFTRGFYREPQLISVNEALYRKSACKLNSYDWLQDIFLPENQKQKKWVQVRFKNDRLEFFEKKPELYLNEGDIVAVEASPGHDIGVVSLSGQVVMHQMNRLNINPEKTTLKRIYRKARLSDIEKWITAVEREEQTKIDARRIAADLSLQMKINDVEFQGDNTKAIFYYTAEDRVDFRELIKILAERFKIRIEMKQIGIRQEARKVGGIGSCGRELCCSSWMENFQSVSTQTARTQQLSLNPQKLAGQCGKLKCCLNFEQKLYEEALSKFPDENVVLLTKKGKARLQKTDVYKQLIWFSYEEKANSSIPLTLSQVNKIIDMNQKRQQPECLEDFVTKEKNENDYQKISIDNDLGKYE
jgi:cell fate regulator YaaT (PSP1 superfamily)